MRASGFLMVVACFVATALLADAVIWAVGWRAREFALIMAALSSSLAGAILWHRQAPATPERKVKLGLGVVLSITAVAFILIYQVFSGWLEDPEVTLLIATIGCFVFPIGIVGPMWKELNRGKGSESKNAQPVARADRGRN
jgi:Kef-type K+ transport system membrane component KefB